MTDEELAAAEAARQNLVHLTLLVTQSVPIPTQDELNQIRQGTMTADDIVDPGNPEMPHTYEQQKYIRDAIDNAGTAPAPIKPVMPPSKAGATAATAAASRPAPRPPEPPKAA